MRALTVGVWLALSLPLAACTTGAVTAEDGSSPTPSDRASVISTNATGFPAPTPRPAPTLTGPHAVTTDHHGATVHLSVGQTLTVALPAEYHVPEAAGNTVARTAAFGGYPTGLPVVAVFTAMRPGRTDMTTTTDYPCRYTRPQCLRPQFTWQVHVLVAA